MAILNGDKIEKLLWENGYDFNLNCGIDGFSYVSVFGANAVVNISEMWQDAEDWYLDTESLLIEVATAKGDVYDDFEPVDDEVSLVNRIVSYGE